MDEDATDTPRTDEAIAKSNGQWSYELRDLCRQIERELAEAKKQIDANHKATLVIEQMLYEAREERDRLAEALREIKNELGVPQPEYPAPVANAVKIADVALAAVKGGTP